MKLNEFIKSFEDAERFGRMIFSTIMMSSGCNFNYTEQYDKVDVYWDYDGVENVGELKYRHNYDSTGHCIVDEGVLLEKGKYDELKEIQKNTGKIPWYVMIFQDNTILLFNLEKLNDVKWIEEERFPKTTMGDRSKIKKLVTYLPVEMAETVKFNLHIN